MALTTIRSFAAVDGVAIGTQPAAPAPQPPALPAWAHLCSWRSRGVCGKRGPKLAHLNGRLIPVRVGMCHSFVAATSSKSLRAPILSVGAATARRGSAQCTESVVRDSAAIATSILSLQNSRQSGQRVTASCARPSHLPERPSPPCSGFDSLTRSCADAQP